MQQSNEVNLGSGNASLFLVRLMRPSTIASKYGSVSKATPGRIPALGVVTTIAVLSASTFVAAASLQRNSTNGAHDREAPLNQRELTTNRIIHVLNRIGFGPRPDDVETVRAVGIGAYIEEQLRPETIDDSLVENKLRSYFELGLSNSEIEARYKDFITLDQSANRLRQQLRRSAAQKLVPPTMLGVTDGSVNTQGSNKVDRQSMQDMTRNDPDLMKQVRDTRQQLAKVAEPIGLLHEEFTASKLIRAVESRRQLQEVLVDFWSNHFNIDIRKAPCGVLKVLDDRDVIRPHIFGKFRDLLEASAKSPAMLVYLDNFQSVADQLPNVNGNRRKRLGVGTTQAGALIPNGLGIPKVAQRRKVGLNENYAREIMELHTLGVSGGYTQQDVHEVARCFTGWSIGSPDGARPRINRYGEAGEFHFYPAVHDNGEKIVLGHRIPAGGGIHDGEIVLDLLASDRSTMRHVSYQLCQRLVSDEPPTSLVNKCIQTWQDSDGNLRQIVRTIVTSPEFYAPESMRKKIKSPYEYAISAVRALNGTLDPDALIARRQLPQEANRLVRPPQGGGYIDMSPDTLLGQIAVMGQPLFQYQAPTGFPEDSRKWVSSGALIARLNFSLALTHSRIKDVSLQILPEDVKARGKARELIDRFSDRILHGQVSASTLQTLVRETGPGMETGGNVVLDSGGIAAMLLGSPEFQRR